MRSPQRADSLDAIAASNPVCDYYCEVGVGSRLAPTASSESKALFAKKARDPMDELFSTAFEPSVLRREPEADIASNPFATEVAMFAFPHGVRVVTKDEAALNAIPVVTSFVLTASDKSRMYGACIVFYERLPNEVVAAFVHEGKASPAAAADARSSAAAPACCDAPPADSTGAVSQAVDVGDAPEEYKEAHAPEAICLLSRVPVFDALMECCRQLFRMRISSPGPLPADALTALFSTPMPSFGLRCEVPLGNVRVAVTTPAANELPHTMAGRDFLLLFQCLDVNNVVMLWALLLAEQKVALQSRMPHVLTMAAETLSALLFPFSWQHVYIPILPERLLDILQAPVPFLIGIDEEVLALAEKYRLIPDEVVQVDLDENAVYCDQTLAAQMALPQKQYAKLYKAIAPFCRPPNTNAGDDNSAASAFPMAPPPDVDVAAGGDADGPPPLSEMSDEEVASAIRTIKAAFLRFFVSLMMRYQDLMIVPPAELVQQPSAVDFFDLKRWMARFSGSCSAWLGMFTSSQSFTQFLEQRLAPRDAPELEVCFFNESIDAKLRRSVKTKFLHTQQTPLLSSGSMPLYGYGGHLVPPAVRTVYNASMIAARPARAQQPVGLLLVLGSGLHETAAALVNECEAVLKREFGRNLLWSRVDVGAALLPKVCTWPSAGASHHAAMLRAMRAAGGSGDAAAAAAPAPLENMAVRDTALDMLSYHTDMTYRAACHAAVRRALAELAADGGANLPLCVLGHGFGSVVAVDYLSQRQAERAAAPSAAAPSAAARHDDTGLPALATARSAASSPPASELPPEATAEGSDPPPPLYTPVESAQTLALLFTLGAPLPLLSAVAEPTAAAPPAATAPCAALPTAAPPNAAPPNPTPPNPAPPHSRPTPSCASSPPNSAAGNGRPPPPLQVPAPWVRSRWPHLRGGWSNFCHRADTLGCMLRSTHGHAIHDITLRRRLPKGSAGGSPDAAHQYFADLEDCMSPIAQALSYVWQDTNRTAVSFKDQKRA